MARYTLSQIVEQLQNSTTKVQLIYAFNGVGKTRLSEEFKQSLLTASENDDDFIKIIYYNAFTEDLFYWDNDLDDHIDRKIKIHPNSFTDWLLIDEGQEKEISDYFAYYTNSKLSANFNSDFSEVTFALQGSDEEGADRIKISKGEESSFIWSVFYTTLRLVVDELNAEKENRSTDRFDHLQYIFIDDPITSLDENHIIELAVDLAQQINACHAGVKFIITTHNPLFYNVMSKETKKIRKYTLNKFEDGNYSLDKLNSDTPFSYHLHLLLELQHAIKTNEIKKYHFNMIRNILEKTSVFLGYEHWGELLEKLEKSNVQYQTRLINISSHSKLSNLEAPSVTDSEKDLLKNLVKQFVETYHFASITKCDH